jgi:RNA polymerase sigma-70 factor (ECF subfamily)
MVKINEVEIVQRMIKKDEKALRIFYNQYYKQVFNFVYQKTKKYHLTEELTQDTFIDFLDALRDFRYQSSLKTFLFSIAKNKTIDFMRKKKIKTLIFSMLPSYVVEGLKVVLMDEEIEKKELTKKIAHVFEKLPNDYRKILRQKYIEEIKVDQIAVDFKLGFKATESLLFRARRAFVKIFNATV